MMEKYLLMYPKKVVNPPETKLHRNSAYGNLKLFSIKIMTGWKMHDKCLVWICSRFEQILKVNFLQQEHGMVREKPVL